MWVTCHECNGSGYNQIDTDTIFHPNTDIPSYMCLCCYQECIDIVLWDTFRGQLWVEDDIDPIDIPTEPSA